MTHDAREKNSALEFLWNFSDSFPRDSFRFWFTHVVYNFAKDAYYLFRVRRF
jgi:hypothetical protein